MARIRTIKPELPQSESMGRVSRDARLLFILIWTLCDDAGRARAASRMLASLLFPYDDDAPGLIDDWLGELEGEGCIMRYSVDGSAYLQVCKWLIHQKIDRPSASKIPTPAESSRPLASPRESSSVDLDLRTKDLDQGEAPPTSFASAQEVAPPRPAKPKTKVFRDWLSDIRAAGEKPVSAYQPVWAYAERSGLPAEWIELAWMRFRERYEQDEKARRKRYTDWRRVFLNAVEGNWLGLWCWSERDQAFRLTTVGIQAENALRGAA